MRPCLWADGRKTIPWRVARPRIAYVWEYPPSGPTLGIGHYLSPGGGVGGFGGDHLIFRRAEGGISRNWEPWRGGSLKHLKWVGGGTQICLDNASLRAYKITAPILPGARDNKEHLQVSICSIKHNFILKNGSLSYWQLRKSQLHFVTFFLL